MTKSIQDKKRKLLPLRSTQKTTHSKLLLRYLPTAEEDSTKFVASSINNYADLGLIEPGRDHRYELISKTAGFAAIAAGFTALAGWILKVPILTSFIPGYATMKVNTAVCFVLVGILLLLFKARGNPVESLSSLERGLFRIGCFFVFAVGSITLAEYLFHWNPVLD